MDIDGAPVTFQLRAPTASPQGPKKGKRRRNSFDETDFDIRAAVSLF